MVENNDLLSLWYGYILKNWLYFEESDDVKVSEDGKRASSMNVDAMKVAIKAKRNPTTEEREADVFFRRTVEIPNTNNADSCHVLQEAGQFTYRIDESLLTSLSFSPCIDLDEVLARIRANVKEIRDDGYVNSNPTGIQITYDNNINLPNLSDSPVSYTFHISTDNVPDGVDVTYSFPASSSECTTSNTHTVDVFERKYCIEYEEESDGNISVAGGGNGCSNSTATFSMNKDMCNGGNVTFSLKLKSFKARLSNDVVSCGKCDGNSETSTTCANISVVTVTPNNATTSYTCTDSTISKISEADNIGCSGGTAAFSFNEGSTEGGVLSVSLDECADECSVNIGWVDGQMNHAIWPTSSRAVRNVRRSQRTGNIIMVLPNNF